MAGSPVIISILHGLLRIEASLYPLSPQIRCGFTVRRRSLTRSHRSHPKRPRKCDEPACGARCRLYKSKCIFWENCPGSSMQTLTEVLARGFHRFKDILSQSHITSSSALAEVLKRLIPEPEKRSSINDRNNKKESQLFHQRQSVQLLLPISGSTVHSGRWRRRIRFWDRQAMSMTLRRPSS